VALQKQWSDLTREDFVRLNRDMSGIEIARTYGVHHNAVYYRLKTFGIATTKRKRRFDPPRRELESLYREKSMAEIAKHYGVGETVVFMRLREHGIGGITRADRLSGKPKSIKHRLAMSASARESGVRAGAKNGNWKGGLSSENKSARSKMAYQEWKLAVLAAAGWRCVKCGLQHGHICQCCGHRVLLHAHHKVSFAEVPSKRYDPMNGLALCERCHRELHRGKPGELLEHP
jgi:hypothetical protein